MTTVMSEQDVTTVVSDENTTTVISDGGQNTVISEGEQGPPGPSCALLEAEASVLAGTAVEVLSVPATGRRSRLILIDVDGADGSSWSWQIAAKPDAGDVDWSEYGHLGDPVAVTVDLAMVDSEIRLTLTNSTPHDFTTYLRVI